MHVLKFLNWINFLQNNSDFYLKNWSGNNCHFKKRNGDKLSYVSVDAMGWQKECTTDIESSESFYWLLNEMILKSTDFNFNI